MGREEKGHRDRKLPGPAGRSRQRPGYDALTSGRRALLLAVLVTVAGGLAAKAAALRLLSGRPPVELLGGSVRFVLAENPGAFLGLGRSLTEAARRAIFVGGIGLILVALLAWLLARGMPDRARSLAAGLMIGGGLANLLDRLPDGRVTDYVVLSAGSLRTGVFNLPDVAILAGAALWLLGGLRRGYSGKALRKGGPHDAS